jgi:cytochrome c553
MGTGMLATDEQRELLQIACECAPICGRCHARTAAYLDTIEDSDEGDTEVHVCLMCHVAYMNGAAEADLPKARWVAVADRICPGIGS